MADGAHPAADPGEGTVHVIGAGLAGLSAALTAAEAGRRVAIWEGAGHAGGRCRSFHDAVLDRRIDNGSHLVLTGNDAVQRYLGRTGAPQGLVAAPDAIFPMVDLAATGADRRFAVHLNAGPIPWWPLVAGRRVPGTRPWDYLGGWRLALAGPQTTVAEAIRDRGPLWRALWEPLTLGILNTTPERGQARLLWRVLERTFLRGAGPTRPMFAPEGLGEALVTPALDRMAALGVTVTYNRPLQALERAAGRIEALAFSDRRIVLGPGDAVILALPPGRLRRIMPEMDPPVDDGAILNAHFRVRPETLPTDTPPLTGMIGSLGQWVFVRGDVISVTVSAADSLGILATPREEIAATLWREVAAVLCLKETAPEAARIIVEKRATFDQSPGGVAQRLAARTDLANLILAGDATDTGLPATIEGAVLSGEIAAGHVAAMAAGTVERAGRE
ncbi:MAG: hydroxysqualene dehydroxylase HpnE [Pseudomonadota bacterium]